MNTYSIKKMAEKMIEVNYIVTLENQNNYWILGVRDYEGDKFVYTERVLDDGEFYLFKCSKRLDGKHLTLVINKELCNDLLEEFEDTFIDDNIDNSSKLH